MGDPDPLIDHLVRHGRMRAERDEEIQTLNAIRQQFIHDAEHHINRRGPGVIRNDKEDALPVRLNGFQSLRANLTDLIFG